MPIDLARPCRHAVGGRWFVNETDVKDAGKRLYVFRAALATHGKPDEVVTDLAQALETVITELISEAFHNTGRYDNNRAACNHGRLKARFGSMRGLKTHRSGSTVIFGHAFVQNLHQCRYQLGIEARNRRLRAAAAFDELAEVI